MIWSFKNAMGGLSVAIGIVAYGIYFWQTMSGRIRPHPLSWVVFGTVTAVGFWVQHDQNGGAGSWVLAATSGISFFLAAASYCKGERHFTIREWRSFTAACIVCIIYLLFRQPTLAAVLATAVDVIGYEPTIRKALSKPYEDSVTSFALNSIKFFPSLLAMGTISWATWLYPCTLIVANAAVAGLLLYQRTVVPDPNKITHQ